MLFSPEVYSCSFQRAAFQMELGASDFHLDAILFFCNDQQSFCKLCSMVSEFYLLTKCKNYIAFHINSVNYLIINMMHKEQFLGSINHSCVMQEYYQ